MRVDDLQRNNDYINDPFFNDDSIFGDTNVPEAEEKIEILCNGNYLKPSLQLNEVKDLYW
jgi:hypothetical protein